MVATGRCSAITRAGTRCQGLATQGSNFCWSHHPSTVEARRQRASKAGQAGGNGRARGATVELLEGRRYARRLIDQLTRGEVDRGVAVACFQGLNTIARFLEIEAKIRQTEEFGERLEALEQGSKDREVG
jgi:hypothetical protein